MRRRNLRDSLMDVRIERPAGLGLDRQHIVAREDRVQFLLRHLDAAEKVLAGFSQRVAARVGQGGQGAGKVVGDVQEIPGELADGVDARFGDFAVGALSVP